MNNNFIGKAKNFLRPFKNNARIGLDLCKVFSYDAFRFIRHSGVFSKKSKASSLGALITKQYHRIEKGLALPAPRPGFGESGIKELCVLINKAIAKGVCKNEVTLAVDALVGYRDFNLSHGIQPQQWLTMAVDAATRAGLPHTGNPVKSATEHSGDMMNMLLSRASVRDFSSAPVPEGVLQNAIRAAQHAPCVCNRQSGRIYLLRDKEIKDTALSYQNGNRGFGNTASAVAIITVDQAEMLEAAERYQHWIDGGMFAQNFLLGVHVQGYGTCPLNWSASVAKDRGIRKALGFIPQSETIIMLVAVGALKDEYKIARSERRPLSEIARFI